MGPRKSNAFASGKDDGAAAGKIRKVGGNGVGASSATNSASHKHGGAAAATMTDIYTNEEKVFLESQLALFTSGGGGSGGTDFARMTKEQWFAGLPTLVSATEKLLQAAAEQYQQTCRERAAAAASVNGAQNAGSLPSADGSGVGKHGSTANSSHANSCTAEGIAPGGAAGSSDHRSTPAGGTPAQFAEENAYIIAQAQQLQWYPFTYQRWVELLLEPGKHHTACDDGGLRGDAIQTSLRRCILVTYPAVEGGDVI
ncbi:protein of unknown function - conserved [Leishmania donovani]|uniref:Hypothetical_protein_conserved n=1 Tax=Leishmania donovani TaxID=5661 RepID=A0A3Q8IBS1_LEIDO|nr:hypothetical protein, conserved [Leishmania donovani]AYU79469.1 hypothetical protein LdCL_250019000 [Leishmania donovani]TPP40746.1 hypothetical protein CGC21_8720 [Leishmania donovani]TPP48900.1 hypothetical protein CGC20_26595 [Leishmania donovani]CAJ1989459.1 protein of unknown function - conserved [Leishmania donovani]CBZ34764.1 hypothetical protein, conserved [Leishmania donovani]